MGIFSDKAVTGTVRDGKDMMFDKRSSNGNVRDTSEPDGHKHAARLGEHAAAVAELHRGGVDYTGRHRA